LERECRLYAYDVVVSFVTVFASDTIS